ncbi:MAG: hypothetical protein A2Y73_01870 [Chloroflexi bacterium RBG_13_56_8]|nr:MAG: hypothetical protein A2Y73_01870 [Chloroflexi bacterium RBG_13_56_8]
MRLRRYEFFALLILLVTVTTLTGCESFIPALTEQMVSAQPTTVPTLRPPTDVPTEVPAQVPQDIVMTPSSAPSLDMAAEDELFDVQEALTIMVYERASPSVVHITSRVITMDFSGGLYPSEGTGSGFVIDEQGHIVTNNHVVEGAQTVEVILLDGTVAEAEIVGLDPLNDLAVIRVDVDPDELYPVDMSYEGQLKVGQRAIAIGNPFGLDWTLTTGVISSLGRPLQISSDQIIYDVIQTDAAINPGNSGGPLLNSRGQLIGVNAAIRAGAENIGFAIPLSTVQRVVPELIENGRYRHPWMGVEGYGLFPELAQRLELPVEKGMLIARIASGSPAELAGLRGATSEMVLGNFRILVGGDIIVAIDGSYIESDAARREYLETRTRAGQEIEVTFYRGDELMTTRVRLGEMEQ